MDEALYSVLSVSITCYFINGCLTRMIESQKSINFGVPCTLRFTYTIKSKQIIPDVVTKLRE